MQLQVNGKTHQTRAVTLAELLLELQIAPVGIAVAVNQSVVRRAHHAAFQLSAGDHIEIIRAVQGG